MQVITIDPATANASNPDQVAEYLEQGNIVAFKTSPVIPAPADCEFLRSQSGKGSAIHKNIAYKPHLDKVTGTDSEDDRERLRQILSAYSKASLKTLAAVFPAYANSWHVDYASFRPFEEEGRDLPMNKRNDLVHVDAFPSRPTHGGRILRLFTNINPTKERVWVAYGDFQALADKYAADAGLGKVVGGIAGAKRSAAKLARMIGAKVPDRSPYDQFMLTFHDYLKHNDGFQAMARQNTMSFKPGQTWMCYTDQVGHAVLSGQYALEQTCIIPFAAMVRPELAPVAVLERLAGRPLIADQYRPLATAGAH